MRLFERLVSNLESFTELKSAIGMDQIAYKEHCNTRMALIKCQHNWLGGLDGDVECCHLTLVRLLTPSLIKLSAKS